MFVALLTETMEIISSLILLVAGLTFLAVNAETYLSVGDETFGWTVFDLSVLYILVFFALCGSFRLVALLIFRFDHLLWLYRIVLQLSIELDDSALPPQVVIFVPLTDFDLFDIEVLLSNVVTNIEFISINVFTCF